MSKSRVNLGAGAPKRKTRKKRAVKMQGGGPAGLSQAQQNLLRGAQEHAARSGQNPATLQGLTAQHGDLYGAAQQKKARRQMAGNQPGRSAMRGIGPGMKKGGGVKKKRGGSIETMASGKPIQWQKGRVGQKRKADYMSYVAPGAAKKQLKKQKAAGGPGRRAVRGAGGAKKGGAVKSK